MRKRLLEAETDRGVNRRLPTVPDRRGDIYWRALGILSWYRVGMAIVLVGLIWLLGKGDSLSSAESFYFLIGTSAYMLFAAFGFLGVGTRKPRFEAQLAIAVLVDVAYLVSFMALSGGVNSGFGVLLIPYLAAVSFLSRGRMTLFHASVAVIAVLGEETWRFLEIGGAAADFVRTGILCIGYFATAWLARGLARYALESQKLAEERRLDLANLAQVNQLVIQTMPGGVLVADASGRIKQVNQQVERLLGPPRVRAESFLQDYHPDLPTLVQRWHEAPECDDVLLTTAANKPVRVRFAPVSLNRQEGVLLLLEDAGREQREAQQLKLAALGRLTASIAHEIRNPLSAIGHASEILSEDIRDPASLRLLQIIGDNVYRIEKIVQDVLALNRRDRARQDFFDLPEFIKNFVNEWAATQHVPPDSVSIQTPEALTISFDRGHLHQILWNLISNAWRHSQQRLGSVRVRLSADLYQVNLEIEDDGGGVPDELSSRLFEPFFTTSAQGNGLGLYIAREICAANNARLEFAGNYPGAVFRITLRRLEENQ